MTDSKPFKQTWGDDFFTSRGFLMLPKAVLEFAEQLNLHPTELALVTALLYWKWDYHYPFPSIQALAHALNRSPRVVQRTLHRLQDKELITVLNQWHGRGAQTTNLIDFTPLRNAINNLGPENLPPWTRKLHPKGQGPLPLEDPD